MGSACRALLSLRPRLNLRLSFRISILQAAIYSIFTSNCSVSARLVPLRTRKIMSSSFEDLDSRTHRKQGDFGKGRILGFLDALLSASHEHEGTYLPG